MCPSRAPPWGCQEGGAGEASLTTLLPGVFLWRGPIALAGEGPCKHGGGGSLWAPAPTAALAFLQNARSEPHPQPLHLLLLCRGSRPSGQPPTPSANLKGNKYKLYKVKGLGLGSMGSGALPRGPHIIPNCSSVLA